MAGKEGGGSNASPPLTTMHVLGTVGNNKGVNNATLSPRASTNFGFETQTPMNSGSATQHAQQNLGSGANNLDGGLQNPPPARAPSNLDSTVPIPNAPSSGEEIEMHGNAPVPPLQAAQSSLTHLSEY
jgi:hypothetical protein